MRLQPSLGRRGAALLTLTLAESGASCSTGQQVNQKRYLERPARLCLPRLMAHTLRACTLLVSALCNNGCSKVGAF